MLQKVGSNIVEIQGCLRTEGGGQVDMSAGKSTFCKHPLTILPATDDGIDKGLLTGLNQLSLLWIGRTHSVMIKGKYLPYCQAEGIWAKNGLGKLI